MRSGRVSPLQVSKFTHIRGQYQFGGRLGQTQLERLWFCNQFVQKTDRPSTSLNSIRSEMAKTTSACVITSLSYGKGMPITNSPNKTIRRFVMSAPSKAYPIQSVIPCEGGNK